MKFQLNFITDNLGIVDIDEPIQFGDVDFVLKQKESGYARDISLSGGKIPFNFVDMRNHYLTELLYYYHKFGFEAHVTLIIDDEVIGEIDFANCSTDDLTYFSCNVIQETIMQIVKRRREVQVNLVSDKDVEENPIVPLVPQALMLQAKREFNSNKWVQGATNQSQNFDARKSQEEHTFIYVPWDNNTESNISVSKALVINNFDFGEIYVDALSLDIPIAKSVDGSSLFPNPPITDEFNIFRALNLVKDGVLTLKHLEYRGVYSHGANGTGYHNVDLVVYYGTEGFLTKKVLWSRNGKQSGDSFDNDDDIEYNVTIPDQVVNIPVLNPNDVIFAAFRVHTKQERGGILPARSTFFRMYPNGMNVEFVGSTNATNSIIKGFRFIDVIKQVTKSISGLPVYAPIYDKINNITGDLYETFITNGDYIRGLYDHPFNVSLDDIEKCITETNCDYQIETSLPKVGINQPCVFFGNEKEFYQPTEVAFINDTQFSQLNKTINERFAINKFSYKYLKYQAKKELDQVNSSDVIHGEAQWMLKNKRVENEKEVSVKWIRDPFTIEEARQKAYAITDNTAYQEDTTLFAIDCITRTTGDTTNFTLVDTFLYTYVTGNTMTITGDESVNFNILGFYVGNLITISSTGLAEPAAGNYIINAVTNKILTVTKIFGPHSFPISKSVNGTRTSLISYKISIAQVPFINKTTQGITDISGLKGPDSFSNIKFSIRRNVENYYLPYLSTANQYHKYDIIKNTLYQTNSAFTCTINGLKLTENQPIITEQKFIAGTSATTETPLKLSTQFLSPFIYNEIIFANIDLADYLDIQTKVRADKGFIRMIDNNETVIKIYPQDMSYSQLKRELIITGELKWDPVSLSIRTENGLIIINEETKIMKGTFDYDVSDNMVSIYDESRQRLYNPMFWDAISINGILFETLDELKYELDKL